MELFCTHKLIIYGQNANPHAHHNHRDIFDIKRVKNLCLHFTKLDYTPFISPPLSNNAGVDIYNSTSLSVLNSTFLFSLASSASALCR